MFEYVNPGFILISAVMSTLTLLMIIYEVGEAQSHDTKVKLPLALILASVFVIAITIDNGFETQQTIAKNKKAFTEGTELVCSTLTTSYLVSKHSGWRLTGINVTNNNIVLDLRYCKQQ